MSDDLPYQRRVCSVHGNYDGLKVDCPRCNAPVEPCPSCGEKDCGGAPRFANLSLDERIALRERETLGPEKQKVTMTADAEPWEWDGECSRCFVTLSWDGDPPECAEDALCMGCVWKELEMRRAASTVSTEDVDRARSWLRSYEAFDPNGRGQARYPTREQLASLTQTLAAQFAAVRAEVNLKDTLTVVGPIDSIAALAGELEWQEKAEKGTATRRRVHPAEMAPLIERMEKGRAKYPAGCTALSLLDEAGEFAHAINKGEGIERIREELLDVAAVAMRLYLGEVDTVLVLDGLVQCKVDTR